MRVLALLLLTTTALLAQDKSPAAKAPAKTMKPLPPGKVRILKAFVIKVEGAAQARRPVTKKDQKKPKWRKLEINDVLEPGVVVRTGRKSSVTLRIGANATMIVDRQTRVAIPEIVQKGKVLKTRVKMGFGRADVKVDRIGLDNDFEVATPTATLAVRGTAWRIWWDSNGFRAVGVPGNRIRAILVDYRKSVRAFLSKDDTTAQTYKLPALDGYYTTYLWPIDGALTPGEYGDKNQDPETRRERSLAQDTGLNATNKLRSIVPPQRGTQGGEPPPPSEQPPPGQAPPSSQGN